MYYRTDTSEATSVISDTAGRLKNKKIQATAKGNVKTGLTRLLWAARLRNNKLKEMEYYMLRNFKLYRRENSSVHSPGNIKIRARRKTWRPKLSLH
jgi:hypothetical protein